MGPPCVQGLREIDHLGFQRWQRNRLEEAQQAFGISLPECKVDSRQVDFRNMESGREFGHRGPERVQLPSPEEIGLPFLDGGVVKIRSQGRCPVVSPDGLRIPPRKHETVAAQVVEEIGIPGVQLRSLDEGRMDLRPVPQAPLGVSDPGMDLGIVG